ncbi:MAG TPA: BolA family protein [Burkholderiales bacterium]|nr:BolA family protein [Burkholderiales bacterium]
MELAARIRERLAALEPQSVELLDESGRHVGHAGAAAGGSHFRLTIVSPRFAGHDKLARHRMIYAALGPLMRDEIHALAIQALTPDEL